MTSTIELTSGTFTLDLNGFKLTQNTANTLFALDGANFTITDLSAEKTGEISSTNTMFYVDSGSLKITNGTYNTLGGDYMFDQFSGTIIVENGTFDAYEDIFFTEGNEGATGLDIPNLTIENGTFNAEDRAVCAYGGNIIIKNGEFTANYTVYLDSDYCPLTATIYGGTFNSNYIALDCEGGEILIKGGTFTTNEEDYSTIYVNYYYSNLSEGYGDTQIMTIEGGKFTSDYYGIYINDMYEENIIIKDGYFEGYYSGGYSDCTDNISLQGGTFKATATDEEDNDGAFSILKNNEETSILDLLGEGYIFDREETEEIEYDGDYYICTTAKTVNVIPEKRYTYKDTTNDVTIDFPDGISNRYSVEVTKKEISEELKSKNVLLLLDIVVKDLDGNVIDITDSNIKIKIPLTEELKKYENYKIAYIKDGTIQETLEGKLVGNFIEFSTTHLSEYALTGTLIEETVVEEKDVTPKTGNIQYTEISALVIISVLISLILLRKEL
ncbi:MAG: hypothetical protein Q4G05_06095 [Clostridia bacterium]|nr:hypothetical protein [Clostridia bacterium]